MEENPKTALLFGGNGFIGSATAAKLLENQFQVICVSRGNWYWDSETRIKPYVTHIQCDRKKGLHKCRKFIDFMIRKSSSFDVIVDFSGYSPEVVEDTLQILGDKTKLYIYISTDSVYEVSVPKSHSGPSIEEDAVRPELLKDQEELNKRDSYGHRKLACEEVIKKYAENKGIKRTDYIILRLPDVIGPRDTTNRWWVYQLWIQFYNELQKPLIIPPQVRSLSTSYVYVEDVAAMILRMSKEPDKIRNVVLNVALEEAVTLTQFLTNMASQLAVKDVQFDFVDNPNGFHLFPSVTVGGVNISKVKSLFNWTPTSWQQVLSETSAFYRNALSIFPYEKDDAVNTLLSYVVPAENKNKFLVAIQKAIDELKSDSYVNLKIVNDEESKTEL